MPWISLDETASRTDLSSRHFRIMNTHIRGAERGGCRRGIRARETVCVCVCVCVCVSAVHKETAILFRKQWPKKKPASTDETRLTSFRNIWFRTCNATIIYARACILYIYTRRYNAGRIVVSLEIFNILDPLWFV
jgi:hypothetical protein